MPYELRAVIGPFELLRSRTAGIREAVVAPLHRRMGLVPVTEQLLGALPPAFEQTLGDWARGGALAQVEAEFHGGDGYQAAAVWRSGARVWGPVRTRDFTGPREDWPINAALARLDVAAGGAGEADHRDLFLQVGLGREQDTDGWRSAGWTAGYDEWHEGQLARARAAAESERRRRLPDVPAALDGRAVMDLLGLPPGPLIGAATRRLQDLHLERGPLSPEEAVALLRAWASEQNA
ncbi:hypothetical protein [Kitasatospora sp. NPDC015120]|uniref:hypothetical protein n=1 Tax=Kitasatospora sp. NPDC015120 TaxID=3364023 RepID=UPI0036F45BDB